VSKLPDEKYISYYYSMLTCVDFFDKTIAALNKKFENLIKFELILGGGTGMSITYLHRLM
jgi:hypothetical protein